MKIFDVQIRSDTRSDDDLRNLHYFDTERVVTCAHAARGWETGDDLLAYFDGLLTSESSRIRRCGLVPHVALGVLPAARPRRTHHEVWRELPFLLQEDVAVAVGEIGAWEDTDEHWELFERQVQIAAEVGLPILVTPPADLRVNMTYKMMQRIERSDLPPEHCIMNHLDGRLVETVVREGFVAGVAVGPFGLDPREAAAILSEAVDAVGDASRIVVGSALRAGAADILGVPKTIVALREEGVEPRTIERLVYGNAMRLLIRR